MKPVNTGLSSFLFLQTVKNVKEISDVGNLIVYKTSFYAKKTKNLSKIVTYHLKKLEELGLVELDHTESIHGIQAKFYRRVPAVVNLKGDLQDDLHAEKELILDYLINDIWTGFKKYITDLYKKEKNLQEVTGDCLNGVIYMTDEEAKKVKEQILAFQEAHMEPKEGAKPWDMALIAYPGKRTEK